MSIKISEKYSKLSLSSKGAIGHLGMAPGGARYAPRGGVRGQRQAGERAEGGQNTSERRSGSPLRRSLFGLRGSCYATSRTACSASCSSSGMPVRPQWGHEQVSLVEEPAESGTGWPSTVLFWTGTGG